jgi:O-antigen/teichoic acid export membrane protein
MHPALRRCSLEYSPVFSVVAPCKAGASPPSVLRRVYEMSSSAPPPRLAGLRRQIVGNFSAQAAAFAVSATLGLITTAVLTRWLDPDGFGGFKFLFAFIYFFQTLNDLGINTMLVRELAQSPDRTRVLVQQTLGLKAVLSTVSMAAAWVAAIWWPGLTPEVRWAVALFALILPIQAFTLPIVTLQARVMVARSAWVEVVNRVTGFAGMMIAVALGYGLLGVTAALVIGEVAGLATVIAITRRFVLPWPVFDARSWGVVLRASLPLGTTGLLVSLVNRVDFLLLQLMLGEDGLTAVGYYGTAYQVTGVLERAPLFIMATLYPVMSRLAADDPAALASLYRDSVRKLAVIAVPMVAVVTLLAPELVAILGGADFAPAVTPLRVLVWSTAALYPAIVAGNVLIALGQTGKNLRAWAVAAPVNIVLNLALIPLYGASGAALATVISFVVVLVASLAMAARALGDAIALHRRLAAAVMPPVVSSRVH